MSSTGPWKTACWPWMWTPRPWRRPAGRGASGWPGAWRRWPFFSPPSPGAILCWITLGVRRCLKGMERLAAGERQVQVQVGGGDELASLAEDVNALSRALQNMDTRQQELARSYRRFVPERVLSLLGKKSILEVDKQTFVSRNLAAMMLSFRFPPQVYEKSGRELFDNLNEIIERTASIVTGKGGRGVQLRLRRL